MHKSSCCLWVCANVCVCVCACTWVTISCWVWNWWWVKLFGCYWSEPRVPEQSHTHTPASTPPHLSLVPSLSFSVPFWVHFYITHPLVLRQTDQTTSHNEVALHHRKHCCVSKWAGEEAGSISALFPNYLLQAEHRWGQEEGGTRRREGGERTEEDWRRRQEMNGRKDEKRQ